MFSLKFACLPLAVAALTSSAPAWAAGLPFQSFGEVEFRSDPVALTGEVKAALAAQIPAGSPIADARALLRDAGARCAAPQADGAMRCRYYGWRVVGDGMENVSWTVDFATADARVKSFTVVRHPDSY